MSDKTVGTWIAEGTAVEGTVVSKCGITLSGELKGDVSAPSLTVEPSGRIDGAVEVSELTSQGEISGRIKAKNIQLAGRVRDNTVISAETLEVKLAEPGRGVQLAFGECELNVGKPVKVPAIGSNTPAGPRDVSKAATS